MPQAMPRVSPNALGPADGYGYKPPKQHQKENTNVQSLRQRVKLLEDRIRAQGADLEQALNEANHYRDRITREAEGHRFKIQVWSDWISLGIFLSQWIDFRLI